MFPRAIVLFMFPEIYISLLKIVFPGVENELLFMNAFGEAISVPAPAV